MPYKANTTVVFLVATSLALLFVTDFARERQPPVIAFQHDDMTESHVAAVLPSDATTQRVLASVTTGSDGPSFVDSLAEHLQLGDAPSDSALNDALAELSVKTSQRVFPASVDLTAAIGATRAKALLDGSRIRDSGKDRSASFPFVTGDGFRTSCTVVFDETTMSAFKSRQWSGHELLQALQDFPVNGTVFVKTELLDRFIDDVLEARVLTKPFVLVTHNSDYSAPWEPSNTRMKNGKVGVYKRHTRVLLENRQVVRWYAQNAVVRHPKLTPIPIGIENRYNKFGAHVAAYAISAVMASRGTGRSQVPLASFSVKTNPKERGAALAAFEKHYPAESGRQRGGSVPSAKRGAASLDLLRQFLGRLRGSAFVLAPKGHGVDTHRLWESLYMGCTAVTTAAPLLDSPGAVPETAQLDVLVATDDYAIINPDVLGSHRRNTPAGSAVLDMNWWASEINKHARG